MTDRRRWFQEGADGSLTPCQQGDPGAVPYDRASTKETHRGRLSRLVSAVNSALTLCPEARIMSWGTRIEARSSAPGRYYDQGLDNVAEFHVAFGAALADEPGVPEADATSAQELRRAAAAQEELAVRLRDAAAAAAGRGDKGGALLLIRQQLIVEENSELARAMLDRNIVECLDGLCDLSYVVDGAYLTLGLGHYKVTGGAEVHSSNMSKLGPDGEPMVSDAGRVIKGPNYRRPDLAAVLGRGE